MAVKAGEQALINAKTHPGEIDMVIVSTTTGEYTFPSLACIAQNELKLINAFCFDISAACTGFIYALDIASQYIHGGKVNNVLLIAAEKLSNVADFTDRATCVLFGDAAAAVVLKKSGTGGLLSSYLKSDGRGAKRLICKNVQRESPWQGEINDPYQPSSNGKLFMDGKEVFKFAVGAMLEAAEKAIEQAGIDRSEIAAVLPHQANIRIIKNAAGKLGIDESKYYYNIHKYGNTSSATIPLLLHELLSENKLKQGDKVLIIAFGGGLTYGAAVIEV
jgi:3-oxoacyl-[acyl-carrier-protein] synthase-3